MKIKHFKLLLNLLFSLSLVFSSCSGGGQQDVAKLRIEFNATDMVCKKGYSGNGEEVASGIEVKEDEDYQFTAKITDDEIVDVWYAGKRKLNFSPSIEPRSYTVKKEDADENNVIHIRYDKRPTLKYTLQFDSNIKCKKGYSGNGEEVASGIEVKEDEDYQFTAKITDDEIVDVWYAGKRKLSFSPSRDPRSYTVKKEDADENNVIIIRCETREVKKATLKFDSSAVECKKGYFGNGEEISSDSEIREGYDYQFKARLKTGEKLKHWLINGKAKTNKTGETFSYTVNKDDIYINDNTITISFEKQ